MGVGETLREIYLCEEHSSLPSGVRLGSFVLAPAISAADPCTGALPSGGLEAQLRATFANMDAFLEAAGVGREHVARVTFALSSLSERRLLNPVWSEWFPNPADRPPHKYVPAALPPGVLVTAQLIALAGARRRVLDIPGVEHQDPMSMGALTGNLITSSRVVAGRPVDDADEQVALVLDNVGSLMRQAGADFGSLTQVTAFVGDVRYYASVERELRQRLGESPEPPVQHVIEADLGGNGLPRIEIIGLV